MLFKYSIAKYINLQGFSYFKMDRKKVLESMAQEVNIVPPTTLGKRSNNKSNLTALCLGESTRENEAGDEGLGIIYKTNKNNQTLINYRIIPWEIIKNINQPNGKIVIQLEYDELSEIQIIKEDHDEFKKYNKMLEGFSYETR
jgi:hypothetical protein